jgi:hypothetical protein
MEGDGAIELYAGIVRIKGKTRVRTHLGVVESEAGAVTTVSLPTKDMTANLDLWIRDETPRPPQLTVRVTIGRATLDGQPVGAGETVTRGQPKDKGEEPEKDDQEEKKTPPAPPPLADDEKKMLDALLDSGFPDVSRFDPPTRHKILLDAAAHRRDLRRFLALRPGGWAYLRPKLLKIPRAHHRSGVADLLVHDPAPASRHLVREELQDSAAELSVDCLLLLAQEGDPDAAKELARRLDDSAEDLTLVVAAVHFALRGDPRGRNTLQWFVTTSRQTARYPALYVAAAAGLQRIGDETYWGRTPGFIRRATNRHLENRRIGAARRLVACLSYFHDAVTKRTSADLAYLEDVIARGASAAELATEAQIREMLAKLDE